MTTDNKQEYRKPRRILNTIVNVREAVEELNIDGLSVEVFDFPFVSIKHDRYDDQMVKRISDLFNKPHYLRSYKSVVISLEDQR